MSGELGDKVLTFHQVRLMALPAALLLVLLLAVPIQSLAKTVQSRESILAVVKTLVLQLPEVRNLKAVVLEHGNLDPRLRLQQCQVPIEAFVNSSGYRAGHITVGVRCNAQAAWTIYVPTRVKSEIDVVALKHSLPRGAVLRQRDLVLNRATRLPNPTPFLNSMGEAVGKSLKRPLAAGTGLTQAMIELPILVRRGETTLIIASRNGFNVRMNGKALENGVEGEVIRVKNLSSNRSVEGILQADGSVLVKSW